MQRHGWSSANPKEPMLHLSLSPCTGSHVQLASSSRHWCLHIEQPQAQHPLTSAHLWQSTSPQEVWDLRASDASWCHHREAQNHFPERFHSPVPGWWNDLPTAIRTESLTIFKRLLKTNLSHLHLNFAPSSLLSFLYLSLSS